MYSVVLSDEARDFFESASAQLQRSLDRCFDRLKLNPIYQPNVQALRGNFSGYYGYRVDEYRVIYPLDEEAKQVFVDAIAHSSVVYE